MERGENEMMTRKYRKTNVMRRSNKTQTTTTTTTLLLLHPHQHMRQKTSTQLDLSTPITTITKMTIPTWSCYGRQQQQLLPLPYRRIHPWIRYQNITTRCHPPIYLQKRTKRRFFITPGMFDYHLSRVMTATYKYPTQKK